MNPLLKRQIRKYLPKDIDSEKLEAFLDAVNKSYINSEQQFTMLQRAAALSSEELYQSNKSLRKETDSQKKIINNLNNIIKSLKGTENNKFKTVEEGDSDKLVDFIENQTQEIIRINKQKDKLVANLERQNQELNDYAHMVSHDLKSPLQSLDALTTWIKDDYSEDLGEGGREIIKLIKENVEKMDTLIQGILEYSTIGKTDKRLYKVNLNVIIDDIVLALENPNNIQILVPNKLPSVIGDQHRLELLFSHLIENAVKFNDRSELGFVEITCEELDSHWKFMIKDNGKGIEKQFFDKIFIAFQKLEDDYKATGIGLSIAKKIVEAYKGEIWVESKPNEETTFFFTLQK